MSPLAHSLLERIGRLAHLRRWMGFCGARGMRLAAVMARGDPMAFAVLKAAPMRLTAMASRHSATSANMGIAAMTAE
jgi:hypothetical protein